MLSEPERDRPSSADGEKKPSQDVEHRGGRADDRARAMITVGMQVPTEPRGPKAELEQGVGQRHEEHPPRSC